MGNDGHNALGPTATAAPGTGAASAQLRTIAVCDLADSTALVERLGDRRAAELFRAHDRLARDLLARHGGREIDKTDGFLALFERPVSAVAFALAYQSALRQLGREHQQPLAARVGIHVGDVVVWENSERDVAQGAKRVEVEGLAKPVAARLMGLARPGQILLSGMAQNLARRAEGELGELAPKLRWPTHGRYRFKGVPAPMLVHEVGEVGVAPLKPPRSGAKARRELPLWRQPGALALEGVAILVLVVLALVLTGRPQSAIAFGERDWVVVGDLRNLTDDPRLDDALAVAFRISLEQSRHVNVLSDLRVRDVLARMQRPADTPIDREVGSEIALRAGARALVLATVADLDGRTRFSAEVIDPRSQTTVFAEAWDGSGDGAVLDAVDHVSHRMRETLGETLREIRADSRPLPEVTSGSLDALSLYGQANAAAFSGDMATALTLFREAVSQDPDFALAQLGIARIHWGANELVQARAAAEAAMAHADKLASRERLYLEAVLASFGPPADAVERWRVLSSLYPDAYPAYYNYALVELEGRNAPAAALAFLEGGRVRQNPAYGPVHYFAGLLRMATEDLEGARREFELARSLDGEGTGALRVHALVAAGLLDQARAELDTLGSTGRAASDLAVVQVDLLYALAAGERERLDAGISRLVAAARELQPPLDAATGMLAAGLRADLEYDDAARDALVAQLARERQSLELTPVDSPLHGHRVFSTALLALQALAHGMEDAAVRAGELLRDRFDPDYPVPAQPAALLLAAIDPSADRCALPAPEHEQVVVQAMRAALLARGGCLAEALALSRALEARRGAAVAETGGVNMARPLALARVLSAPLERAEWLASAGRVEEAAGELTVLRRHWPGAEAFTGIARRMAAAQATPAATRPRTAVP